ncbi:MAG: sensor histidine kinase [Sulfurovum sp.]|nr:sensor histidine kinase [Sulfurovum sp.]MDD3499914.1 sensor histidine kinase [Sulfurovum sp.]
MNKLLASLRYLTPKEQLSYLLAAIVISYQLIVGLYDLFYRYEVTFALLHFIFMTALIYFTLHYIKQREIHYSAYGVLGTSSLYFITLLYLNDFTLSSYFFPILLPIGSYLILSFKESTGFILLHYAAVTLVSLYGYLVLGVDSAAFAFIPLKIYLFIVIFIILFGMVYHLTISENYQMLFDANQKKALALSEIHHRIKNNLHVVSSMLSINKFGADQQALNSVMLGSSTRIEAISLIHKLLYRQKDFASIDFESYVDELSSYIFHYSDQPISLEKEIDPLQFSIKTMQHLGIILAELLTNSVKYAFSQTTAPKITISLKEEGDLLRFVYRDNGRGYDIKKLNHKNGLGSAFIKASTEYLNGEMHIECSNGLRYEIRLDPLLKTQRF